MLSKRLQSILCQAGPLLATTRMSRAGMHADAWRDLHRMASFPGELWLQSVQHNDCGTRKRHLSAEQARSTSKRLCEWAPSILHEHEDRQLAVEESVMALTAHADALDFSTMDNNSKCAAAAMLHAVAAALSLRNRGGLNTVFKHMLAANAAMTGVEVEAADLADGSTVSRALVDVDMAMILSHQRAMCGDGPIY